MCIYTAQKIKFPLPLFNFILAKKKLHMIWSQLLYNVFQLWIRCINFRIFKNLEKLIGGLFTFTHQKIYQVGNSLFWVRGVLQISILSGREDSFGMHTLQNKDIPHQAVNEFHLVLLDLSHSRTLKKMTVYCWLVWSKCIFFLGICINSWFFFFFSLVPCIPLLSMPNYIINYI